MAKRCFKYRAKSAFQKRNILEGKDDPEALAQLAKGKLRPKIAELERALVGQVTETQRLLLRLHLEHIDDVNTKVQAVEAAIEQTLPPFDENELLVEESPKQVNGRKRHILVDRMGNVLKVVAHAAHVDEPEGAKQMLNRLPDPQ